MVVSPVRLGMLACLSDKLSVAGIRLQRDVAQDQLLAADENWKESKLCLDFSNFIISFVQVPFIIYTVKIKFICRWVNMSILIFILVYEFDIFILDNLLFSVTNVNE